MFPCISSNKSQIQNMWKMDTAIYCKQNSQVTSKSSFRKNKEINKIDRK